MSVNDYSKALTAEDLIRRYNLNNLSSDRKKTKQVADSLLKTETLFNNFVDSVTKDLENIQSQVDGNITTWFLSGIPTLENSPANEWTTDDEKNNHLGDLYYDKDTGYAYRFSMDSEDYVWIKITDNDVTEALAIANSAQDTADSKRRIFVVEPTTPYEVGDVWIKDDKDLYRCRAKRESGDFNTVDWILATDYSNDDYAKDVEAQLNQFKTTVTTDYVTNVRFETTKDSIESSVSSVTTKVETIEPQIETIQTDLSNATDSLEEVSNKVDAIEPQLETMQEDINENTSSIEDTSNKISDIEIKQDTMQSEINNNTTALENSMLEIDDKLQNYAPITKVTELEQTVSTNQTNTQYAINVISEIKENGVSKLKSTKGFTFDDDGLCIDEDNSPTKFQADTNAIWVTDKNNDQELLFAGYDEALEKSIVRTSNLWVKEYFSLGNSLGGDYRMEIINDETYGKGIGFFYIGGDD